MRTFELQRAEDETGVSGTGIIAQGAIFDDGWVTMRWLNEPKTTTLFPDMKTVEHIHGHGGKTKIVYTGDAFGRGYLDCTQDRCEGAWFASVGGPAKRTAMVPPSDITPDEQQAYLAGYKTCCPVVYGADWES